jgi:hypothetical protein
MSKKQREEFKALVDRVLEYDNRHKLSQTMAYFFGCLNAAIEDDHDITNEKLILWLNSAVEFVIERKR